MRQKKRSGHKVIKLFSCSTQLSMKFQLLIKTKILTKKFLALSLSDVVFILLINAKMPTIVGILTFMSRINFMLSLVEYEKGFITSGPEVKLWVDILTLKILSLRHEEKLDDHSEEQIL